MARALADRVLTSAHGVYTGATELKDGSVCIWLPHRFCRELADGNILGCSRKINSIVEC